MRVVLGQRGNRRLHTNTINNEISMPWSPQQKYTFSESQVEDMLN